MTLESQHYGKQGLVKPYMISLECITVKKTCDREHFLPEVLNF